MNTQQNKGRVLAGWIGIEPTIFGFWRPDALSLVHAALFSQDSINTPVNTRPQPPAGVETFAEKFPRRKK